MIESDCMKYLFLVAAVVIAISGCTPQNQVAVSPNNRSTPEQEIAFFQLGMAVGNACIAQLSGSGDAQKILFQAGFSKNSPSAASIGFSNRVSGGTRSIWGQDMGAVSVSLPLKADLSGYWNCRASVSGFQKGLGDAFFMAFQAAGRVSSLKDAIKTWGRYENGTANMGMKIRRR